MFLFFICFCVCVFVFNASLIPWRGKFGSPYLGKGGDARHVFGRVVEDRPSLSHTDSVSAWRKVDTAQSIGFSQSILNTV